MRQLTPGLILEEKTNIQKVRELPLPGEILVKVGDLVNSDDIIARAELPGELRILKIPEQTGLEISQVLRSLSIKEGQQIKIGQEILNFKGLWGFFKTTIPSPVEALVEFISQKSGHVGLRLASRPIELKAYLAGKVVSISGQQAVTIESSASFFQGIFGLGGERIGRIRCLEIASDQRITADKIPDNCTGEILIGGTAPDNAALKKIAGSGASGLICGGIDGEIIKSFLGYELGLALTGNENIPFTLIITEGFGALAISAKILELSKRLSGELASINGATQVRAGALRPELIVSNTPLLSVASPIDRHLTTGSNVRIIRYPYFGQIAKVIDLPEQVQKIATGAESRVVKLLLNSTETILVPRANVELV